jgi:hypothetical protein
MPAECREPLSKALPLAAVRAPEEQEEEPEDGSSPRTY